MRLLLDTHVAIWALIAPERLSPAVRDHIGAPANSVFVSAASIWEIAIKHALGRRGRPPFSGADAFAYFREAGYMLLPVTAEHAAAVESLPPLHTDPFDRLLVAQARSEPLWLVTADPMVVAYDSNVIAT